MNHIVKRKSQYAPSGCQGRNCGFYANTSGAKYRVLKELEEFAHQENIPVIPHETVAYFRLLMQTLQPKRILEVGTAIGFSALLMADNSPHSKITTIDRNEEMIGFAKENFAKYDYRQQIELLEGEAMDILPTLPDNTYDFIFMDSAKSKYIVFYQKS